MPKCSECKDTGVIETGNNSLPCNCEAGEVALFNVAWVDGPVTGQEMRRHFLNPCPEPISAAATKIPASDLPGRRRLKPFHESIVDVIQNALWFELQGLSKLLLVTKIPKNHDAIIEAWTRRAGVERYKHVVASLRQQKAIAELTNKS
ncbi:MAG: hypothetical protein WCT08_04485 [Patescibacteria group bacterium]|jgi:hypothetical protein